MQPLFIAKNLPFSDIRGMLSEVDLDEISLFSLCDRLGRGNMSPERLKRKEKCRAFTKSVGNI